LDFVETDPYIIAKVEYIEHSFADAKKKESKAILESLKAAASTILNLNPEILRNAQMAINNNESPTFLTHFISSNSNISIGEKKQLLKTVDGKKQAHKLLEHMLKEVDLLEIKKDIQSKASSDIDQQQREYYLRQQIKVLQEELGMDS